MRSREADLENGERIYFIAANVEGERISYTDGPDLGGMMMGSYLTCAACHGPDAHGGRHPDGEPLDQNMPRWEIREGDLADLLAFLNTIPE
jgi:mono/diheme cytochrome c family protein